MHSYSKFWLYAPLIRGKSEHYSFSGATNQALYCARVCGVLYVIMNHRRPRILFWIVELHTSLPEVRHVF